MGTQPSGRAAGSGAVESCAHCGARVGRPVVGLLRTSVVVYCSAGCRDDHLAALALVSSTCAAPGCDLDVAADVPFCDEHLDPAVRPPTRGSRGSRAA
ncbi:MAG: hypothetical protein ACHQE5_12100 [Actinomycetes bacterium]